MTEETHKDRLSGWLRVWIVVSLLAGVFTLLLTMKEYEFIDVYMGEVPVGAVKTTDDESVVVEQARTKEAMIGRDTLSACPYDPYVTVSPNGNITVVRCRRPVGNQFLKALPAFFVPGVLFFIFGWIGGWVRRGFSQNTAD